MNEAELIQRLLAPVLIIPACGLLILSTSARFVSLLARIRAQHLERLDVYRAGPGDGERDRAVHALRIEGLEVQTHRMLRRAALQRRALMLLFLAVIGMVLSSLLLGLSLVVPVAEFVAGAAFVLGLLSVGAAMCFCIAEMADSLTAIRYEHERVEALCAGREAPR